MTMDADGRSLQPPEIATTGRRSVPSLPHLFVMIAGALAWGALMALSAVVSLYMRNRLETFHLQQLVVLFFAGGLLAWPFVILCARYVVRDRRIDTRLAACFVLLACSTIAMTAFLFGLGYRNFYSQWHQPLSSWMGIRQFFGTFVSAVYQFAVLGLGLYLPVGLPILAAASLWLAKAIR